MLSQAVIESLDRWCYGSMSFGRYCWEKDEQGRFATIYEYPYRDGKRDKSEKHLSCESYAAKAKKKFMTAFVKFVEGGFREGDFSKTAYEGLYLHCGLMAHYNREGFYGTYFETALGKIQFWSEIERHYARGLSGPWVDVEAELIAMAPSEIAHARAVRDAEVELAERKELERLVSKYPDEAAGILDSKIASS